MLVNIHAVFKIQVELMVAWSLANMIVTCLRVSGDEDVVRPLRGLVGDSDSLRLGFLLSVDDGLLNY